MIHGLDAELFEPLERPYHVEHRVHSPDFVQVHLLRRHAVHSSFGFPDQPEGPHRPVFHLVGHGRSLNQPHQLAHVPAVRLWRDDELDLLAADARAAHLPHRDPNSLEAEPNRQLLEPGDRQPQVNQRT